jgi:hypothetical protein
MLNDYVEVTNGKIINLSFQVDLMIDKKFTSSNKVKLLVLLNNI